MKTCVDCQKPFLEVPKRRPRIRCYTCSPAGPKKAAVPRSVVCPICGTAFATTVAPKRTCSQECRWELAKAQMRAKWYRDRSGHVDRSARKCGYLRCGATFLPKGKRVRFCSTECRTKERYRLRGHNTHKRRAKRFGCEFEQFDKREVFERDGWRCRYCATPTPAELSGLRLPNSPELDHYVPMSAGGGHTRTNTVCSCRRCNMRKKTQIPDASRGIWLTLPITTADSLKQRRAA